MAAREYSSFQQGVIKRYYDNLPQATLDKLGELVTELYLAKIEKRREQLWQRVAKAMAVIKVPKKVAEHILSKRDPVILAANLKEWLKAKPNTKQQR
jgi:hypothetical protein